ncbi:type I-MYXAN CRISPR-associated endonuclease Cas1 [bacterium]|nr:type I-MYXAN CRISPR-associated endonuclease Cas1 [bacterium]
MAPTQPKLVADTAETNPSFSEELPLRVMALHALLYCERLFYLEEVEEIYVADANVYAGRRLHVERVPIDDEAPELRSFEVASTRWGLKGKVDAVRRRDGNWVAYEHKRGRCRRGEDKQPLAWPSDRIQAIAYAVLLEEELGESVQQARVRYHADNVTAFIEIDDRAREDLRQAIQQARQLQNMTTRPPVTENERLCKHCSLAPVCLPEEERLAAGDGSHPRDVPEGQVVPLPANRQKQTLHVTDHQAYLSRSRETLVVKTDDQRQTIPVAQIDAVVIHGSGQVTTQALQLCAYHGVAVQWMSFGGRFVAGTTASPGRVQQRIRQYQGLTQEGRCLELARITVRAKVEGQLKYLLRATRGHQERRQTISTSLERIRETLRKLPAAMSLDSLRGLEGMAAKSYFAAVPSLLNDRVASGLIPAGRTKHPPKDRCNALLSYCYQLLFGLVHRTVIAVGLEPALGYYHQPRSAAPPLVSDIMEIFRVPLVDMPLIGSLNRLQWDAAEDFTEAGTHFWLSDTGRKKAIALFEARLQESAKHPHTGKAMSYARLVELEVRLLEKEWSGAPGLFGKMRIR